MWTSLPASALTGLNSPKTTNVSKPSKPWYWITTSPFQMPLFVDGIVSKYRIALGSALGPTAIIEYDCDQHGAYRGRATASETLALLGQPRRCGTALEAWSLWCSRMVEWLLHRSAPSAVGHRRAETRERERERRPHVKTSRALSDGEGQVHSLSKSCPLVQKLRVNLPTWIEDRN